MASSEAATATQATGQRRDGVAWGGGVGGWFTPGIMGATRVKRWRRGGGGATQRRARLRRSRC